MKRFRITQPMKVNELTGRDGSIYEDLHDDWQEKAERLQARRWKAVRRAMREGVE